MITKYVVSRRGKLSEGNLIRKEKQHFDVQIGIPFPVLFILNYGHPSEIIRSGAEKGKYIFVTEHLMGVA